MNYSILTDQLISLIDPELPKTQDFSRKFQKFTM